MNFRIQNLRPEGDRESSNHEFALEILEGLSKTPKELPSRLFYNGRGSELFESITDLREYYLTACEFEIFRAHKEKIAAYLSREPFNLIELGSGDGRKTVVLMEYFLKCGLKFRYIPIDISEGAMRSLRVSLEKQLDHQNLVVEGLVAEYFEGINWLVKNDTHRNLVLFLGSNIGNFSHAEAEKFLRHLWYSLNPDDYLLIGCDLKKDPKLLYHAYNDSHGVTSEFNLNLLDRVNEELTADFNRSHFLHQGLYNVSLGAMESYLISTREQTVNIRALGRAFPFRAWEGIHTEFSYKYTPSEIRALAKDTGYEVIDDFSDSKNYYMDSFWKAKKS